MNAVALFGVLSLLFAQEETRPAQEVPRPRRPRLEELPAGVRIEVKGRIAPDGLLRVEDVELRPPGGRDSVLGPIEEVRAEEGRLRVFGIEVEIPRTAEVLGEEGRASLAELAPGAWAEVEGTRKGRRLRARRVRIEEPRARVVLQGVLEEVEPGAEETRIRILGLEAAAQPRTRVDVPETLAGRELSALLEEPPSLRRRTEEDFVPGTIRLGERLTLGGTVTTKVERKDEFDLDPDGDRDRTEYVLRTRLEATWQPRDDLWVVAGVADSRGWEERDAERDQRSRRTVLRETFVFARDVGFRGLDLEAGRLHFRDDRQWLYDRDLDGVRVAFHRGPLFLEGSVTTVALGGARTEEDEETTNVIALAALEVPDLGEFEAYVIDRQHRGREKDSPFFAGLRGSGEPIEGVRPWFEAAYAGGVDDRERIRGYGFDLGATFVARAPLEPSLTLGYAFGSGGDRDPRDGDANFRQTGLQDNVDKWNGVASFQYYGELLDPELSNLEVATAGVGFRPARRTSLDLVVHRYRQPRPAPFLRDAELRSNADPLVVLSSEPDGVHEDLGWEWNAILGWRRLRFLDLEIVAGRFHPGDAFAGDRAATFLKVEVRVKF